MLDLGIRVRWYRHEELGIKVSKGFRPSGRRTVRGYIRPDFCMHAEWHDLAIDLQPRPIPIRDPNPLDLGSFLN